MNAVQFIQDWIADARAEIAAGNEALRSRASGVSAPQRVKYPNICADAEALGCSRVHLYLVLSGRRSSRSLRRRYAELQGGAA